MNLYYNRDKSRAVVLEAVTDIEIMEMDYGGLERNKPPVYWININMVGGGRVEAFEVEPSRESAEVTVAKIEGRMKSL